MKVSLVDQMRELDRRAGDEYGISDSLLMENAGLAAHEVLRARATIADSRFVVVCGAGNNGGDGLVVARKLLSNGGHVVVFLVGDPGRYAGAARLNYDIARRLPIELRSVADGAAVADFAAEAARSDRIVDAVFGTGLTREVTGRYRATIEAINAAGRPVVSLDIPSGVNGDTGAVMGVAVRADDTVTFGLPKVGNVLPPGSELCGRLHVSYISYPPALQESPELKIAMMRPPSRLPRRPLEGLSSERALFVSGAHDAMGAPYFAAQAFLRSGGNLACLAGPSSATAMIASRVPEVEWLPQRETRAGGIALTNLASLVSASQGVGIVVLGGGLAVEGEGKELVREYVTKVRSTLLLDGANAMALVNGDVPKPSGADTCWVLNPTELGTLIGQTKAEVLADRISAVRGASRSLGAHLVLKGLRSLVAHPDGDVFVNPSGNPGMITAGSGAAQLGAIAAMRTLGLPLPEACRTGVFLHGLASDLAADKVGVDGMTAQDILDQMPPAVRLLREGPTENTLSRYAGASVV